MLVVARYAEISFLSALLSHGPISVYVWEWAFYEANIMSNQMKVREICKKSRKKINWINIFILRNVILEGISTLFNQIHNWNKVLKCLKNVYCP